MKEILTLNDTINGKDSDSDSDENDMKIIFHNSSNNFYKNYQFFANISNNKLKK